MPYSGPCYYSGMLDPPVRPLINFVKLILHVGVRPTFNPHNFFHSFFKPLLGEENKIEVTSMELNIFFSFYHVVARLLENLTK